MTLIRGLGGWFLSWEAQRKIGSPNRIVKKNGELGTFGSFKEIRNNFLHGCLNGFTDPKWIHRSLSHGTEGFPAWLNDFCISTRNLPAFTQRLLHRYILHGACGYLMMRSALESGHDPQLRGN